MALSPEQRSLHASLAAHSLHGQRDSRALTAAARKAFLGSFERRVVEEAEARGESLTPAEVARRAEHLRKAHFLRMALASAKARRTKAAS